jgi:hypothetical protein
MALTAQTFTKLTFHEFLYVKVYYPEFQSVKEYQNYDSELI